MAVVLGSLLVDIRGDIAGLRSALEEGNREAGRFAGQVSQQLARSEQAMQSLQRQASAMGNAMKAAGLAVAGAFAADKIGGALAELPRAGIAYAGSMETAKLGMAGTLVSMTTVSGKALEMSQALAISGKYMKQLQDAALSTAATSEELIGAFQAILGPGLAAKMTLDQIAQLVVVGTNATKSMGLASRQVIQEIRDLVQGGIQASSSTLATALGVTDADIKRVKTEGGDLFAFLMDRLNGYSQASSMFAETLTGRMEGLKEGAIRAAAEGFAPLTEAMKSWAAEATQAFVTVETHTVKVGDKLQEVKSFRPNAEATSAMAGIAQSLASVGSGVAAATRYLIEHRETIGTLVTMYATYKGASLAMNLAGMAKDWMASKVAIVQNAIAQERANLAAVNAATGDVRRAEVAKVASLADLDKARTARVAAEASHLAAAADFERIGMLAALAKGQHQQIVESGALATAERRLTAQKAELAAATAALNGQTGQTAAARERLMRAEQGVAAAEAMVLAERQRLMVAESEALAMSNALIAAEQAEATAKRNLTAATATQTAAMETHAAATLTAANATARLTMMQRAASLAMSAGAAVAGLARSALALVGGPIGAISLALMAGVWAWQAFGSSATKNADEAVKATGSVTEETKKLTKAYLERNRAQGANPETFKQVEAMQGEIDKQTQYITSLQLNQADAEAKNDKKTAEYWGAAARKAQRKQEELKTTLAQLKQAAGQAGDLPNLQAKYASGQFTQMVEEFAPKAEKMRDKLAQLDRLRKEEIAAAAGDKTKLSKIESEYRQAAQGIRDRYKEKGSTKSDTDAYQAEKAFWAGRNKAADTEGKVWVATLDEQYARAELSAAAYVENLRTQLANETRLRSQALQEAKTLAEQRGDKSDAAKIDSDLEELEQKRQERLAEIAKKERELREANAKTQQSQLAESYRESGKLAQAAIIEAEQKWKDAYRRAQVEGDSEHVSRIKALWSADEAAGAVAEQQLQLDRLLYDLAEKIERFRREHPLMPPLQAEAEVNRLKSDAAVKADQISKAARDAAAKGGSEATQQQAREISKKASEAVRADTAEWRKSWDQISDGLTDALFRGFENGESFSKNFLKTLENTFKTAILKPQIEAMVKWAMPSTNANGITTYGGLINSGLSLLSNFKSQPYPNMGKGMTGGLDSDDFNTTPGDKGGITSASSWIGMAKQGWGMLKGLGGGSGGGGAGGGNMLSNPWLWVIAGMVANGSLWQQGWKYSYGDLQPVAKAWLSPAYDVVHKGLAGLLGDKTASVLDGSSLITRAFGHRAPEVDNYDLRGTFSAPGKDGQSGWFGMLRTNIVEEGGWFSSDRHSQQYGDAPIEMANTLSSTFNTMLVGYRDLASKLQLDAGGVNGYSKLIDIRLDKSLDPKGVEAAIGKAMADLSDDLARALIPNVKEYAKQGETASQTASRLADTFRATDLVLNTFGRTAQQGFGAAGMAAEKARTELVEFSGGAEKLTSSLNTYYGSYYGTLEQTGRATKELDAAMRAAGLQAIPASKTEFRRLAEAADLNTQAGRQQFAALMKAVPAMEAYTQAMEAQTKTVTGWGEKETGQALFEAVFDAKNATEAGKRFAEAFGESFQRGITGIVTDQVGKLIFEGLITPMSTAALAQAQAVTVGGATAGAAMQTGGVQAGEALIKAADQQATVERVKAYLESMGKVLSDPSIKATVDAIMPLLKDFGASTYNTTAGFRGVTGYKPKSDQDKDADKAAEDAKKRAEDLAEYLRELEKQLAALGKSEAALKLAEINQQFVEASRKLADLGGATEANIAKLKRLQVAASDAVAVDVWRRLVTAQGNGAQLRTYDTGKAQAGYDSAMSAMWKAFGADGARVQAWLLQTGQSFEQAAGQYWGALTPAQKEAVTIAGEAKAQYLEAVKATFDGQLELAKSLASELDSVTGLSKSLDDNIASILIDANRLKREDWLAQEQAIANGELAAARAGGRTGDIVSATQEYARIVMERYQADKDVIDKQRAFARELGDYAKSLKTGDLSPLALEARLAEATRQTNEVIAKARGGDADAQGKVQQLIDTELKLGKDYWGTTSGYSRLFDGRQSDLLALGADTRSIADRKTEDLKRLAGNADASLAELRTLKASTEALRGDVSGKLLQAIEDGKGTANLLRALGADGEIAKAVRDLPASIVKILSGKSPDATPVRTGRDSLRDGALVGQAASGDIWGAIQQGMAMGYRAADLADAWNRAHPSQPVTESSLVDYAKARGVQLFAKGGIAHSESVFGEAGPEAAVPLPDGRTIPVTINWTGFGRSNDAALIAEVRRLQEQVAGLQAQLARQAELTEARLQQAAAIHKAQQDGQERIITNTKQAVEVLERRAGR